MDDQVGQDTVALLHRAASLLRLVLDLRFLVMSSVKASAQSLGFGS
jgi:hypothetical protein